MVYEEGRRQTPQAQGAGLELVLVGKYVSFWNDREPEMEPKKKWKKRRGKDRGQNADFSPNHWLCPHKGKTRQSFKNPDFLSQCKWSFDRNVRCFSWPIRIGHSIVGHRKDSDAHLVKMLALPPWPKKKTHNFAGTWSFMNLIWKKCILRLSSNRFA